jgi:hypothetical protein
MKLSVREVLDLSERCFVAAGFDHGTARANGAAVWWAEAYRGTGLATLRELLDPLERLDATTPALDRRNSPISVLDGRGLPCVVSAGPALNLACAHADQYGTGITRVAESAVDADGELLGALAHRGADRGYVSVVLSAADNGQSRTVLGAPDGSRPVIAETELAAPSGGYAAIKRAVQTGQYRAREAPLFRACFDDAAEMDPYDTTDARLFHRFLRRSTESFAGGESIAETEPDFNAKDHGGFVVGCVDPRHPRYSDDVGRVANRAVHDSSLFERNYRPGDVGERVDRLVHEGVEVDRERWRAVFEFSNGVLAPPFEGSEKGAGFDLNELEG